MAKIKANEATGLVLNWLVTKALCLALSKHHSLLRKTPTRWSEEQIQEQFVKVLGHAPSITSMRCYVARSLGEEVEVPAIILHERDRK